MKLLSIIFSFRNEEKNIPELINRITSTINKLNNWKYELIFVNDASDDNSEKILIEKQKTYKIKIINMSRNFGTGPCVLAGLKNASGDAVVYMDSDLQVMDAALDEENLFKAQNCLKDIFKGRVIKKILLVLNGTSFAREKGIRLPLFLVNFLKLNFFI